MRCILLLVVVRNDHSSEIDGCFKQGSQIFGFQIVPCMRLCFAIFAIASLSITIPGIISAHFVETDTLSGLDNWVKIINHYVLDWIEWESTFVQRCSMFLNTFEFDRFFTSWTSGESLFSFGSIPSGLAYALRVQFCIHFQLNCRILSTDNAVDHDHWPAIIKRLL